MENILKFYAFDWDDNIMIMPTEIILLDENNVEVGMNTEDFSNYRLIIGKEVFKYKNRNIIGLADNPFRYFITTGNQNFLKDTLIGTPGPAWDDFVECINNGSIFAIITARGHNPEIIRKACYNLIINNHNGINKDSLLKNLKKIKKIFGENIIEDNYLIEEYLNNCQMSPVSYGNSSELNPEEGKILALTDFIFKVNEISKKIKYKSYIKNDISNNFLPMIGFSDDDIKNIKSIKKHFNYIDNLKLYLTSNGKKKLY